MYSTIKLPNGDLYEGAVVNGRPHGYGVLTSANGDCYKGEFSNGRKDGYGVSEERGRSFNVKHENGMLISKTPA